MEINIVMETPLYACWVSIKGKILELIIWFLRSPGRQIFVSIRISLVFLTIPPVMRKRMWLNMGPYDGKCSQWWGTDHSKITTERPESMLLCIWPKKATAYSANMNLSIWPAVYEHMRTRVIEWNEECECSVSVFFPLFLKILLLDSAKLDIKFSFLSWYRIKNSVTLWTNRRDTRLNACSHILCWLKKSALELSWHWTK